MEATRTRQPPMLRPPPALSEDSLGPAPALPYDVDGAGRRLPSTQASYYGQSMSSMEPVSRYPTPALPQIYNPSAPPSNRSVTSRLSHESSMTQEIQQVPAPASAYTGRDSYSSRMHAPANSNESKERDSIAPPMQAQRRQYRSERKTDIAPSAPPMSMMQETPQYPQTRTLVPSAPPMPMMQETPQYPQTRTLAPSAPPMATEVPSSYYEMPREAAMPAPSSSNDLFESMCKDDVPGITKAIQHHLSQRLPIASPEHERPMSLLMLAIEAARVEAVQAVLDTDNDACRITPMPIFDRSNSHTRDLNRLVRAPSHFYIVERIRDQKLGMETGARMLRMCLDYLRWTMPGALQYEFDESGLSFLGLTVTLTMPCLPLLTVLVDVFCLPVNEDLVDRQRRMVTSPLLLALEYGTDETLQFLDSHDALLNHEDSWNMKYSSRQHKRWMEALKNNAEIRLSERFDTLDEVTCWASILSSLLWRRTNSFGMFAFRSIKRRIHAIHHRPRNNDVATSSIERSEYYYQHILQPEDLELIASSRRLPYYSGVSGMNFIGSTDILPAVTVYQFLIANHLITKATEARLYGRPTYNNDILIDDLVKTGLTVLDSMVLSNPPRVLRRLLQCIAGASLVYRGERGLKGELTKHGLELVGKYDVGLFERGDFYQQYILEFLFLQLQSLNIDTFRDDAPKIFQILTYTTPELLASYQDAPLFTTAHKVSTNSPLALLSTFLRLFPHIVDHEDLFIPAIWQLTRQRLPNSEFWSIALVFNGLWAYRGKTLKPKHHDLLLSNLFHWMESDPHFNIKKSKGRDVETYWQLVNNKEMPKWKNSTVVDPFAVYIIAVLRVFPHFIHERHPVTGKPLRDCIEKQPFWKPKKPFAHKAFLAAEETLNRGEERLVQNSSTIQKVFKWVQYAEDFEQQYFPPLMDYVKTSRLQLLTSLPVTRRSSSRSGGGGGN